MIKLADNQEYKLKANKKYFDIFPIGEDLIISANIITKDKWTKKDGKFVKTGKQEEIIQSYRYRCGEKKKS